jgi:hypothetical protein
MDINKIFGAFEPDEEVEINDTTQVVLDGPMLWIGMFKKLISNYEIFAKQIIAFFKASNQDLDIDDIERASSYMVYTRAYDNLSRLDLENPTHLEALKIYSDKHFETALSSSLKYYEDLEEYERCAFIKQIQNILNLS